MRNGQPYQEAEEDQGYDGAHADASALRQSADQLRVLCLGVKGRTNEVDAPVAWSSNGTRNQSTREPPRRYDYP
jgi:hypothetical protein